MGRGSLLAPIATAFNGMAERVQALLRSHRDLEQSVAHELRTPLAQLKFDLELARTFAEHGANIVSYGGVVEDQLAKNWYTVEVGDVKGLRTLLASLRNLEAVFDAYRVTPS